MAKRRIVLILVCAVTLSAGCLSAAEKKTTAGVKAKVAATPQVKWAKMFSQDDWTDREHSLIQSSDGGYYVTGQSSRKNQQGKYDSKLLIWKLDASGNRL